MSSNAIPVSRLAHRFREIISIKEIEPLIDECLLYWNSREILPTKKDDLLDYWSKIADLSLYPTLVSLVQGIMSFPHGNADVERLFSAMNNVDTSIRNLLGDNAVTDLLQIKTNIDQLCYKFVPSNAMEASARSAAYKHHKQAAALSSAQSSTDLSASQTADSSETSTVGASTSVDDNVAVNVAASKRKRVTPKTLKDYMCI